jgi:hypothetical protein
MNIRKRELERLTFAIRAALAQLICEADCWPAVEEYPALAADLYFAAKDAGLDVDDYAKDIEKYAGRTRGQR